MDSPQKTEQHSLQGIAKYLYVLGWSQLLGLNLAAFFWFAWAAGIAEKKRSSMLWVLWIHGTYVALSLVIALYVTVAGTTGLALRVWSSNLIPDPPLWVAWSFCGVMAIIYGIPIFWLLRRDVRAHFMP